MKKVVCRIINLLVFPFAFIWNAKVSAYFDVICNIVYSSFIRHRFCRAKNLQVIGRPLHIMGGKNIEVGDNVQMFRYTRIEAVTSWQIAGQTFNPKIKIGDNAVINSFCHIGCLDNVEIGNYSVIGARTYITDHTHGTVEMNDLLLPPRHRKLFSKGPVVIGKYVLIGEGCAIMPGVTIGDHAVIGANSVVTKDIPPYCVAAGNPAKVIKNMSENKC